MEGAAAGSVLMRRRVCRRARGCQRIAGPGNVRRRKYLQICALSACYSQLARSGC